MHGHGLNDGAMGAAGDAGGASGSAKTTARRKSEAGRSNGNGSGSGGKGGGGGGVGGGGGHERSASLGQSGLLAGMTPAAAAAAAAVTAAAAAGGGRGGAGHNRTGSGPMLMGQRGGGDGMSVDKQEWDSGGRGPLPSLDSVTGGLRNLQGGRHGSGGGQGGGTEVRYQRRLALRVRWPVSPGFVGTVAGSVCHRGFTWLRLPPQIASSLSSSFLACVVFTGPSFCVPVSLALARTEVFA